MINFAPMKNKMKVEIWSDVMCPFCYIGKRKFEKALAQFPSREKVEIEWKSYQLSPDMKTDTTITAYESLARHKGISVDEARAMNNQVVEMAKSVGLVYNMEKSVVANSFNAHRFTHFAKAHGKQNEAEELLFRSYFTDGKNIDDFPTLIELGNEIGLDASALKTALEDDSYADDVRHDIYEAQQLGVRGVPFFVFDRKYGVSGAQETQVFLQTLEKSFDEWETERSVADKDAAEK